MTLATERMLTLQVLESALSAQLWWVDQLLPAPMVFGRKRWRAKREAARSRLQVEHFQVWVTVNHANTIEEIREAVESAGAMLLGPKEAARLALSVADLPEAKAVRR